MWDLRLINPFGNLSKRNLLFFFATMLVAAFAYIFVAAPTAYAADATWKGNAISYNGDQYLHISQSSSSTSTNLPAGIHYGFIDAQKKAHVISFPSGADLTKTSSADYSEYSFTPPGSYTNKSNSKTISIDTQSAANQGVSSCDGPFLVGIGWIVCPVTNFLSGAMDWLFEILTGFLTVRPAQTGTDNALYRAWSMMRNFANIAFVIGFLVIIYSQLTSMGISNYGIKKTLPRLIIAAILVNVSYWVCAVAIDVSNILGYSLQDVFISMRNTIIGSEGNSWDVVSWKSIGGFILSGGTAAVAAGVGIHALAAGTIGGAVFLLLPILVGVLMAVLVALLVMAARQAIITVLVILAPLAFVAYLLPNTEKYFDKWKDLFMTMLLIFPIFSVLFGGAQLAGIAIIQNADSINLIILGMAVQVAPVVITPLLVKFSGSLLGRIAGMVNNPNKGAIDRTRKWAEERAGQHKDRVLGQKNPNWMGRRAQNINAKRRKREDWQKVNQSQADNNYRGMEGYAAIESATREAGRTKQILDNRFESDWNIKAHLDTTSIKRELELQITGDEASRAKERVAVMAKEFQAGKAPEALSTAERSSASMVDMLNRSQDTARDLALTAMRKQSAEGIHKSHLAKALLKNSDTLDGKSLQDYAGGIDEHGANSALATAVSIDRKQYGERVAEASAILKHFNISGADRQAHAMGTRNVELTDSAGNVKVLDNTSTFTREAAIEAQLGGAGNMANIEEIIMNSGGRLDEFKTTISEGIVKNGISAKAVYWGGKSIDEVAQGKINGETSVSLVINRAIAQGKIKPATLTTMDQTAVQRIRDAFRNPDTTGLGDDAPALAEQMRKLQASAYEALTSDTLKGNVAQNVAPLLREIMGDYTPPTE
jgi:hypothetical protein